MKEKIKEILMAMYGIGHAEGALLPNMEHGKEWAIPEIFADEIISLFDKVDKEEKNKTEFAEKLGINPEEFDRGADY